MSTTPRIAVAGAGLGGLVCARVLQRHGVPVTVFERETDPRSRSQGGTLDIDEATGQTALRAAGLFDRFLALSRPEGQEWRLYDHHASLIRHDRAGEGDLSRPEIDRGQLRALLLESLAPGTVRWGRSVRAVVPLPDGTARLHHHDRTGKDFDDFDLVVGADGAWSRVRPALSDAQPSYAGVTMVEAHFDDVDDRHPGIARLVGHGTMAAKAGRRSLVLQRNSDGHVRAYVTFRGPQDWHAGLDLADTDAVRARLLDQYQGWHESLLDILRGNEGGFVNRPMFVLPVPHTWRRVPGVTLLGDAAHLMPPVGVGANLALLDGAQLARAVIDHPTVDAALDAYENVMLTRAADHAGTARRMLATLMPDTDSDTAVFPDTLWPAGAHPDPSPAHAGRERA
ncbi:FAD-dependent oxidoreductase [Streptomyces albireticuli]|uniref:Flavin-dependent monooxygenase n=1 Tax=Streptomyces albireticuli TaxID=1940 RepID=A0A2A2D270_9ACTN|nr:NAD(P)/FAD-dependent oxidoreductase [Streptomyces albireticuli]MCD9195250.1 FAD-dependent monooxygenase [Streptomyces albireticuli]PAU45557.1 FAD-dependent oxidoreductase [Streptomyces albireticuli]